jgi:hypothetical protein
MHHVVAVPNYAGASHGLPVTMHPTSWSWAWALEVSAPPLLLPVTIAGRLWAFGPVPLSRGRVDVVLVLLFRRLDGLWSCLAVQLHQVEVLCCAALLPTTLLGWALGRSGASCQVQHVSGVGVGSQPNSLNYATEHVRRWHGSSDVTDQPSAAVQRHKDGYS